MQKRELIIPMPEVVDIKCYKDFRRAYENTSYAYDKYIIDLRATKKIFSCMFGMLLQMHEHLEDSHPKIYLVNCDNNLTQLFNIASFDTLFTIEGKK